MVDDGDLNGDTFSALSSSDAAVFRYNSPGARISSYPYTAGIRGVSFEANAGGTDLGLRVIGENSAFPCNAGDIGSPGILVAPEPTALSLGALGLLGLIFRQRLVARR